MHPHNKPFSIKRPASGLARIDCVLSRSIILDGGDRWEHLVNPAVLNVVTFTT